MSRLPGKLVNGLLPPRGISGQRLSHETRLVFQREGNLILEVLPQRAFRHPEQDGHRE
jgi:hypothetical protein